MTGSPGSDNSALPTDKLTWTVLLGRWLDFARSALALPQDAVGQRLRDSVPDVIMLQAVWFALQHLDELDHDERALGLDRAELLIDKHAATLHDRFAASPPMPDRITELIHDAREQLHQSRRVVP